MKITLKQLKQLILEQMEEGAAPYGRSSYDAYGTSMGQTYGAARDAAMAALQKSYDDKIAAQKAEDEATRLRRLDIGAQRDRELQASDDRKRTEYLASARKAELAPGGSEDVKMTADSIFKILNKPDSLKKAGLPKLMKAAGLVNANREGVELILNKKTLDSGENAGKVLRRIMKPGWKPGLFGLGFMGLEEEIQQMVKEEVARQLRNKR